MLKFLPLAIPVALLIAFANVAHAADPAVQNQSAAAVVKMDTNYKIGDRYGYRTKDLFSGVEDERYTLRVTGLAENQVIFNDGHRVTDRLGNDLAIASYNRLSEQQVYVPEYGVGRKWTTRYRLDKGEGNVFHVTLDFEVVAREQITVPAGTFDAYRIEGGGYMHQVSGYRKGACKEVRSNFKIWIAPGEVRRYIATEYAQRGAALGCRYTVLTRTDLVYFQQDERLIGDDSRPGVENYVPGDATLPEYGGLGPL